VATASRTPSAARIFLLGQFAVEAEGGLIPAAAWRKRRPVDVLTALALAPGRALHREELIDRFWADKDLDAGANNLHRALHDLRRITGVELATLERGVARLAEWVWVDVEAFEKAASSEDPSLLGRAVELYAGGLLPDDPYSDTLAGRREGLRQRFVDVALKLAEHHRARERPDACIAVLRRALEVDPALEPAHRLLMEVLARAGRKGDALRQFAECVAAVSQRLDTPPARATLDLRASIDRGELDPPERPAPAAREVATTRALDVSRRMLGRDPLAPIQGRAAALSATGRLIEAGRGVLLVMGEAGLGKTRLAADFASKAAEVGATVLAGMAPDLDSGIPYAPFVDAWADHRRRTASPVALDPFVSFTPSGASAQEDRLRLFQSVERSIEALAASGPMCLVIEDLHQADPSSLHLFHHLARATRTLPLLLAGTLREEDVRVGTPLHTLVGSLGREHLALRVVLERLDPEAARLLVAELTGSAESSALADAVYALAEGNPFFTEEVVRAMREDASGRPGLPANVKDTVLLRVRRLGRDAERLFSTAALIGPSFAFETARAGANLEPEKALDALELGIDARLVVEDGAEYRFRHALVRQALLDGLTQARRVYLHRALAEILEREGAGERESRAEALAHHHLGAGQLDRALPFLLAAARRAQARLGFSEAIAFLERALELMDATGADMGKERFHVLRSMGGMRMALSDLDGAVRDLDAAATLAIGDWRPAPAEVARVRRIAALALMQSGRLAEASERLDQALAALGDTADDADLASVLYHTAQLRWHEERYAEARELARRSLAEAERRADRRAICKGHEMIALACHALGEWQEGRVHEEARQALAEGALDVDQTFDVHLCLWEYHLYGDQGLRAMRATVDQTLEQAERMKAPRAVALCKSFAGTLDFQAGLWPEAEAKLREAVELFRKVGSASGEALSIQRLGVLLTARGDVEAARSLLDEGIAVGGRAAMRSHCLTRLHASLVRNRLAAGDRAAAQASLREGLAEASRHGHCSTCNSLLLPEAVRVELALDDVAQAERHAARLHEVSARFGSRAWTAMAEHARGRVLGARGRGREAYDALERARGVFEQIGCPYEAARCVFAQSLALSAAGEGQRAASLASEARGAFARLGATPADA
jgi:DNA-binding SARP family transcriptional activator/tetratricopeptide (TPR) repeat protein